MKKVNLLKYLFINMKMCDVHSSKYGTGFKIYTYLQNTRYFHSKSMADNSLLKNQNLNIIH